MFTKKTIILIVLIFCWCSFTLCPSGISDASSGEKPRLGVWITVFSPEKVLHSKENVDDLILTCKNCGINDIYIQIYRADEAYYDSALTDRTHYEEILAETDEDTLAYLIAEARKNDLKIHAWINLLSIARNRNANVLKKFGKTVLTLDQHGRSSMQSGNKDELDKYYIRENQLFLEPGDKRVRQYLADIAEEIVRKYPGLSGLHLDYVRYPTAVPFIPGSRFTSHGISYGYSDTNTENFMRATGIDPDTMNYSRENSGLWDDWRRKQVTELVRDISERVRGVSPDLEISCTTVPSIERSYLVTLQNWTKWLRKGYADYIVIMNYTDNTELLELNSDPIFLPGLDKKVHMGVGAYLLKDKPEILEAQLSSLQKLSPAGIIIFSYDDIAGNKKIRKYLADNFKY